MKRTTTKPALPRPHRIFPTALYFYRDVQRLFRLTEEAAAEEIAAGRLRVSEVKGRYRFLGAWLLEWLAATELPSRPPCAGLDSAPRPVKED